MKRFPERRARGERQGSAKLTADQVRELRRLAATGWSQRALARRFGISKTQAGAIVRGEDWVHLLYVWRPSDWPHIEQALQLSVPDRCKQGAAEVPAS